MIIGLDVHKKETVAFVVRGSLQSGEWLPPVKTTNEGLAEFLAVAKDMKCIIEASTSGKAVARWLLSRGVQVDVLPADVLQSHLRRAKSDKLDARDLARIGLLGEYRTCYIPTAQEEELRAIVRHIRDIREDIAKLKNQVKAIAQRNLVPEPPGNLDNARVRRRWGNLNVPPMEQRAIRGKLAMLEKSLEEEHDAMGETCLLIRENNEINRLLGIKGIDIYTATTVVSHCGDFTRFPEAKKVASYAGLTPRLNQSGGNMRHGRITKAGPNMLRHVLIEAAHNVVRHPGRMQTKYQRLKQRIGAGRAIVAIARTLITAIWRMSTTQTPYHDLTDQLQAAKIWRTTTIAKLQEEGDKTTIARLLKTADVARAHRAWLAGRSRLVPTGGPS